MKTILYSSFYVDKDPLRYSEILEAVLKNLDAGFSFIVYYVETHSDKAALEHLLNYKMRHSNTAPLIIQKDSRPTFEEIIALPSERDSIKIIQNLDVHFTQDSLNNLKSLFWENSPKFFVALSRWDVTKEGAFLLDRPDSADTWAWMIPPSNINLPCSFCMPGIDNRTAAEFHKAGYKVINPSKDVKTYHIHQVKTNNYRENGTGAVLAHSICPEPYYFHPPQTIEECLKQI